MGSLSCFRCDNSGQICNVCGESEPACHCADEEMDLVECPDCQEGAIDEAN